MIDSLNFNPPVLAHRGASAYAPENTMAAFRMAHELGIVWVEFDVTYTACATPIVFHDEELKRTTRHEGLVKAMSWQELQKLDAGSWFQAQFSAERVPNLAMVLAFLSANHMRANLEIKPFPGEEKKLVDSILIILKSYPAFAPHILFSSFSSEALFYLRQKSENALIGLLLHEWLEGWQDLSKALQVVSIHVNEEIMTRRDASVIKQMGKKLLCYTVNDAKRARALFALGVDAVFSDYPDVIAESVKNK